MRMEPGSTVEGILCIKLLFWSPDYKNCRYRVRWACGHVGEITGNALTRRIWMIRKKRSGNLCPSCAHAVGIDRTRKTCKEKAARRARKTLTPADVFNLMAGSHHA